jgi:hypothetical protein
MDPHRARRMAGRTLATLVRTLLGTADRFAGKPVGCPARNICWNKAVWYSISGGRARKTAVA